MTAYYNEHDPFAAAWLRELIADGLIAPGVVDERSIESVTPADLTGFVQCHFFAGIGVWSLALRECGWPDSRPVWTGSCPCQPFSDAGKGAGLADERHLWPAFFWLICQCCPDLVAGEQVASRDGLAWLDVVSTDLEAADYAFGAVDTCAAGFGAPHIRQRLYWMAHAAREAKRARLRDRGPAGRRLASAAGGGDPGRMDDRDDARPQGHAGHDGAAGGRQEPGRPVASAGLSCGMAGTDRDGLEARGLPERQGRQEPAAAVQSGNGETGRPGPVNGLWRNADWLGCRDGRWRPVEAGTFPLAPVGSVRNRVGSLRGAGNAVNVAQAIGFVEAMMEVV